MGSVVESYCDNCGESVGQATLRDAVQINALGNNGLPVHLLLCTKPVDLPPPKPLTEEELPNATVLDFPFTPRFKVTGCARKILTKSMLARLYQDVAEYTGDESLKPFEI